jgi:hypothetical protein
MRVSALFLALFATPPLKYLPSGGFLRLLFLDCEKQEPIFSPNLSRRKVNVGLTAGPSDLTISRLFETDLFWSSG